MIATAVVAFSSFSPFNQPIAVEVKQDEFLHDRAILTILNDNADAKRYVSGAPMTLTYGFNSPALQRTFYGVVNHVEQDQHAASASLEGRNSSRVVCVGASFPLKEQDTKSWKNRTAPQVVAAIASQFRLTTNIQQSNLVWPSLTQAGQSYWQFLVELAQKIGFVVYCNGILLHFHERSTNPGSLQQGGVPLLDVAGPIVKRFGVVMGSESPSGGTLRKRQLSGVDRSTGKVFTISDSGLPPGQTLAPTTVSPLFTEIHADLVVDSLAEAQQKLGAAAANNKLFVTAMASIVGDARITQGMLVYIQNATAGQSGLWYVVSARHHIQRGSFITDLVLGRESIGATQSYSFSPNVLTQPTARLLNNEWIAA